MTTVATDGKTMAADSLETVGDTIVGQHAQKLWRLSDGSIAGGAGLVSDIRKLLAWLEDQTKKPPSLKEVSLLVLRPNGKAFVYSDNTVAMPADLPAAIGTGFRHALTAMDMGADPKKAVEMAIKRDVVSGGKVNVLKL